MSFHTTKNGAAVAMGFNGDSTAGIGSSATGVLDLYGSVVFDGTLDLNGEADGLILDADGDTTLSSPTDDQIDVEINGADDFTFTANKFNVLSGSKVTFATASSAAAANSVLMGGGTNVAPLASSTADDKFMEFRAKSTATSGDNRLLYMRYDLGGAAGGGECLRANTVLTARVGTAHGAHLGLETTSTTGSASGSAIAMRATLLVDNAAVPAGGNYFGGQVEIYSAGSSSSLAAVTKHAILDVAATGDATGAATVLNAISITGISAADATKMISSVRLAELPANSVAFAVLINGVRYYVPCVLPSELN